MSGATIILTGDMRRAEAKRIIDRAPLGYVVQVRERNRSTEQSDKMWAMLTDIARAKPLARKHTPNEWKIILMHEADREMEFEMDLKGKPFPIGYSSSKLTVSQMSEFIEYLYVFGAENAIIWSDPAQQAA